MSSKEKKPCCSQEDEEFVTIKQKIGPDAEEVLLEGDELDTLGKDLGMDRNAGESDADFRVRMALAKLKENTVQCLEALLAKRRADWHQDEEYLLNRFDEAELEKQEKFIHDYIAREEVNEENSLDAAKYFIVFPRPCILRNDLRSVMIWLLSTVPRWERDPCMGCTYCIMGKTPEMLHQQK